MLIKQLPKVVTSCRSRFWIFEQANQLNKYSCLQKLIADYPKNYPQKFGIPKDKIEALVFLGIMAHGWGMARHLMPSKARFLIDKNINIIASKLISLNIPKSAQFFIGISSFSLDSINFCRSEGISCAVDHASIHLMDQLKFINEEAERWGVSVPRNVVPSWVIEKEDKEFSKASKVFCVSNVAQKSLVSNGVEAGKIFVNHLGVNLQKFTPGPDKKSDKHFNIVQAGQISISKGVLTLIQAFNIAKISHSTLHFAGLGIKTSGIETVIDKLKNKNVQMHGGLNFNDLLKLYQNANVFVLASVADGFGLVVTQAMACGLPVIVTDNVGASDLIVDGVNGFIVPVGSSNAIAEKLKLLSSDRLLCREMGKAARKSVESGLSWDDYGLRLYNYLKQNCFV